MAEDLYRTTPDLSVGDDRDVFGILVPFGVASEVQDPGSRPYLEKFRMGSFSRTIRERGNRIKVCVSHDRRNPIGRFHALEERPEGLWGSARIAQTERGDEALELVRDGVFDGWSVGFAPISNEQMRGGGVERLECRLSEASLCGFPQHEGALVGVRSLPDYDPTTDPERRRYRLALGLLREATP